MVSVRRSSQCRASAVALVVVVFLGGCARWESAPAVDEGKDSSVAIDTKGLQASTSTLVEIDWHNEVKTLAAMNTEWPADKIAQRAMVKVLDDHAGSNKGVLTVWKVEGLLGKSLNDNMFGKYIPPDYSHGLQYKYATFKVNAKCKIIDGTDLEP